VTANSHDFAGATPSGLYDPAMPIDFLRGDSERGRTTTRRNQRLRKAQILATIRRLLVEHGFEGVTMRRIAEASGHAVQTVYNLVGPRDEAIVAAVSEYTRYVGRTASPRPEDPQAVMEIIDRWLQSVEAAPEFCRQVSLIYFTRARGIFYAFRDLELKGMHQLLQRQQKCGALRPETNLRDLAEQLVLFASALCVDWADRPYPLEQLRRRLYSGYGNLLAQALSSGQTGTQAPRA
jgi:AcrR family transcriptional regulator